MTLKGTKCPMSSESNGDIYDVRGGDGLVRLTASVAHRGLTGIDRGCLAKDSTGREVYLCVFSHVCSVWDFLPHAGEQVDRLVEECLSFAEGLAAHCLFAHSLSLKSVLIHPSGRVCVPNLFFEESSPELGKIDDDAIVACRYAVLRNWSVELSGHNTQAYGSVRESFESAADSLHVSVEGVEGFKSALAKLNISPPPLPEVGRESTWVRDVHRARALPLDVAPSLTSEELGRFTRMGYNAKAPLELLDSWIENHADVQGRVASFVVGEQLRVTVERASGNVGILVEVATRLGRLARRLTHVDTQSYPGVNLCGFRWRAVDSRQTLLGRVVTARTNEEVRELAGAFAAFLGEVVLVNGVYVLALLPYNVEVLQGSTRMRFLSVGFEGLVENDSGNVPSNGERLGTFKICLGVAAAYFHRVSLVAKARSKLSHIPSPWKELYDRCRVFIGAMLAYRNGLAQARVPIWNRLKNSVGLVLTDIFDNADGLRGSADCIDRLVKAIGPDSAHQSDLPKRLISAPQPRGEPVHSALSRNLADPEPHVARTRGLEDMLVSLVGGDPESPVRSVQEGDDDWGNPAGDYANDFDEVLRGAANDVGSGGGEGAGENDGGAEMSVEMSVVGNDGFGGDALRKARKRQGTDVDVVQSRRRRPRNVKEGGETLGDVADGGVEDGGVVEAAEIIEAEDSSRGAAAGVDGNQVHASTDEASSRKRRRGRSPARMASIREVRKASTEAKAAAKAAANAAKAAAKAEKTAQANAKAAKAKRARAKAEKANAENAKDRTGTKAGGQPRRARSKKTPGENTRSQEETEGEASSPEAVDRPSRVSAPEVPDKRDGSSSDSSASPSSSSASPSSSSASSSGGSTPLGSSVAAPEHVLYASGVGEGLREIIKDMYLKNPEAAKFVWEEVSSEPESVGALD
jgi:hypothetical protein